MPKVDTSQEADGQLSELLEGLYSSDARWQLLEDLEREVVRRLKAQPRTRKEAAPLTVMRPLRADHQEDHHTVASFRHTSRPFPTQRGRPPVLWDRVDIAFDVRMRQGDVLELVRRLLGVAHVKGWAPLRARPWTLRRKSTDPRSELLRHVCIKAADLSWDERRILWNKAHPKRRFRTTKALQTRCHDAEEQLTGDRHGLEWFYDPAASARSEDLNRLAAQGDRDALRELRKRNEDMISALVHMGVRRGKA